MNRTGNTGAWQLHAQLAEDTHPVAHLALSELRLMDDANHPWLILIPRVADAVELVDLDEAQQATLMREISAASRALQVEFKPQKINVAALGNVVPQLHVHVIARRSSDAAWPRPVWGVMPPLAHDAEEVQNFISALRRKIWLG